jgi:cytoskeletal protein RodZ
VDIGEKTVKLVSETQKEQLKEIGQTLKKAREKNNLPIDELAFNTRIRQIYLAALEEGRFEDLPEGVFVQGFVRRYAEFVGLDAISLAYDFGANFLRVNSEDNSQKSDKKLSLTIPLFIPYILLLAGAISGLFYILNPRQSAESITQNQITGITSEEQKIPDLNTPSPTPSNQPQGGQSLEVALELRNQSWLQVKADGKIVFEGTLEKGEKKTLTAKKELTVRSKNAGAVLISANKKEAKPLGGYGEIKEITLKNELVPSPSIKSTSASIPKLKPTPTPTP